jgi:hypothetical protein
MMKWEEARMESIWKFYSKEQWRYVKATTCEKQRTWCGLVDVHNYLFVSCAKDSTVCSTGKCLLDIVAFLILRGISWINVELS